MLNEEMIAKAKEAKSVEELLALAKANNVELTEEEAKAYFAQLNPKSGELDDDELDAVAGGGCSGGQSAEAVDPRPAVKYEQLCEDFRCHCGGTIHDFTSFAAIHAAKTVVLSLVAVIALGMMAVSFQDGATIPQPRTS